MNNKKTYTAKPGEIERKWWIVDAEGKILGRMAGEIALILRGKDKPQFTPHVDAGDFVVVVNASKVKLTGNKAKDKMYYNYSGYVGGLKSESAESLLERKPRYVIEHAVKGMLPKNYLSKKMLTKLKVYAGPDHPHEAQKPEPRELKYV